MRRDATGVVGRWKWRSLWREGSEGMKEGSVWVMTKVGMYLNFDNAVCMDFGIVGREERMLDDIGAGVAKIICLNGPKDVVAECKV